MILKIHIFANIMDIIGLCVAALLIIVVGIALLVAHIKDKKRK